MVLLGKLITELGIKTKAERFYKLFQSELHEVQNHCERIHHTKLHEGEDWHDTETVKHWTYVIGDEVHTCYESIEEVDEENKKMTWKLFGGDIDKHYKVFKLILEVRDKADGTAAVKWTLQMVTWTTLTNALETLMLIFPKQGPLERIEEVQWLNATFWGWLN